VDSENQKKSSAPLADCIVLNHSDSSGPPFFPPFLPLGGVIGCDVVVLMVRSRQLPHKTEETSEDHGQKGNNFGLWFSCFLRRAAGSIGSSSLN